MDYEDEQVKLIGGDLDGLFGKNVSLADSFFSSSLKFNKEIASADIMAKDKGDGNQNNILYTFAMVNSPYRLESKGGGYLTIHNPTRLLEVRFTNGDVHYFSLSGSDKFDTRYEPENE